MTFVTSLNPKDPSKEQMRKAIKPHNDKLEGHIEKLDDYYFLKYDKHD